MGLEQLGGQSNPERQTDTSPNLEREVGKYLQMNFLKGFYIT